MDRDQEAVVTHLVVFKSPEGKQAYHQAPELDDALRFIEHLRNAEGIDKAKLFKLDEVPLEFKTVVKVEVASDEAPPVSTPSVMPVCWPCSTPSMSAARP